MSGVVGGSVKRMMTQPYVSRTDPPLRPTCGNLATAEAAAADADAETEAMGPATAAKEILVVDDDAGIRRALVEVLRDEGYRVTLAENGHRALQILALRREDPPSLILLDLMMPVMDGGSFLEAYTSAPSLPAVPVVVLSGNLEIHQRRRDNHVIVYLRKPINLERLLETLELWAR